MLNIRWAALAAFSLAASVAAAQPEDSVDRDYAAELPRIAPTEPAEALATFEVHPGFRMELVASEPLVRDPIAMDFDEHGRLFVVEMTGYSEQRDETPGDIRMLTDSDGDGIYDEAKTVVDNLPWATAVLCYKGGLFVGLPPDILYCRDTDGDEVMDSREVIFTGFSLENVQGMMNSLRWGIDNFVHGATGTSGAKFRRPAEPEADALVLRGRDFAFDPETYAYFAESGGGQHGMSYDRFGQKFMCSNSDHCQVTLFEDAYVARNPGFEMPSARRSIAADGPAADVFRISPVEPWREVRTRLRVKGLVPGPVEGGGRAAGYFTSATGITIYEGDAYPQDYRGQVFVGDVGGNLIHRKSLRREGLEWIAERADEGTEFIRSRDIWFRPVQFANGPDGCLYVADMYREVIEHPESLPPVIKKHLDLTSGNDRGRIYRIVPKDFAQPQIPDLGALDARALVAQLDQRNAWNRITAARLLAERQDSKAVESLGELLEHGANPEGRIHALYALRSLDALKPAQLEQALKDPHPFVRVHALRVNEAPEYRLSAGLELGTAGSVPVRLQAALSIGAFEPGERVGPLAALAITDGGDSWMRAAVLNSAAEASADVLALYLAEQDASATADMLDSLAQQAGATATPESAVKLGAALESYQGSAPDSAALRTALARGMAQGGHADLIALLDAKDGALRQGMLKDALDVLRSPAADAEAYARSAALAAALDPAAAREAFMTLLTGEAPEPAQVAAARGLRAVTDDTLAPALAAQLKSLPDLVRLEVMEFLFSKPGSVQALLAAMESGAVPLGLLDSTRWYQMMMDEDEDIRARASALHTAVPVDLDAVFSEALALQGEPQRGKLVYEANCAQCHRAGGVGHAVGPDLETLREAGAEKIVTNILWPNKEVNPQYFNYIVETKDFETYSGVIESDTAASVTLKRALGARDTLLKSDIETMESSGRSIMPEDWGVLLPPQSIADVAAYILGL
ncbi:MAG: c-type cytochrome [Candidatus Hydrogenedens sp.]|nr:c-type cytochrome [Candidatus Hydrogenedens sp.]